MERSVARREIKYLLDLRCAENLRSELLKLLAIDSNGSESGYIVRSLYFDTIYDNDYYDKIDGLETRRKIRLRIYTPEDKTAKLEVKEKVGDNQWKRSATISREDVQLVISGRYSELFGKYDSPFLQMLFYKMETECYRPKTIIEYNRLAFMNQANETRITFDSSLRATESNFDLFSAQLPLYPILYPVVLEVKYRHFLLSYIKHALDMADQAPISISKYCLGRQISLC